MKWSSSLFLKEQIQFSLIKNIIMYYHTCQAPLPIIYSAVEWLTVSAMIMTYKFLNAKLLI